MRWMLGLVVLCGCTADGVGDPCPQPNIRDTYRFAYFETAGTCGDVPPQEHMIARDDGMDLNPDCDSSSRQWFEMSCQVQIRTDACPVVGFPGTFADNRMVLTWVDDGRYEGRVEITIYDINGLICQSAYDLVATRQ